MGLVTVSRPRVAVCSIGTAALTPKVGVETQAAASPEIQEKKWLCSSLESDARRQKSGQGSGVWRREIPRRGVRRINPQSPEAVARIVQPTIGIAARRRCGEAPE